MSAFNLNKVTFQFKIDDVSTGAGVFIAIPDEFDGDVVEIRTTLGGVITGANAIVTPSVNGVAMTNGALTIPFSGSAIGDSALSRPTGLNTVRVGDIVELNTDGGSTGAQPLYGTVVILR